MSRRHHKDDCCCEKKCFVKKCCWEPYDPCCEKSCCTPTFGGGIGSGNCLWIIIVIAIIWCLCGDNKRKC
jgi:hypothetical protein